MKYWNEESILKNLSEVIGELSHFPTSTEIKLSKRPGITGAIQRSGKGFAYFRDKLGFAPKGWTNDKILKDLSEICLELSHFPTCEELRQLKRSDLIAAIRRSGENIERFRLELGFDSGRRPNNYWRDNLEEEIKWIIKKLGHFPTQAELAPLGKTHLSHVIQGKVNEYREKFGFKIIERTKRYWLQWENLEKELKPLIQNGKFPSIAIIYKTLGGGASRSVWKFGGIAKVARKMGYEPSYFYTTTDGHFVHSFGEYLFDEFLFSRAIQHETNGVIHPNYKFRYDFKINDIYVEIWGFKEDKKNQINVTYQERKETKKKLYSNLGLTLISIEYDLFSRPLEEIENYFVKTFSDLGFDITVKLKDYDIKNVVNYYDIWNEEKVTQKIKEFINKHGHFPKAQHLTTVDNKGLRGAIIKYGGFNYFANKLGHKCKKQRYWTQEKIIEQIKTIANSIKRFPKLSDLNSSLSSAVAEYGGIRKIKLATEQPSIKLIHRKHNIKEV